MATRLRKLMLVLGTTILAMQAVLMPIGIVHAETTIDTEEHEQQVEIPLVKNYLEDLAEDPRFFFTQSQWQGMAEEPLQVKFFSDQEVSEARVLLPEEATLLKDQLLTGISVEEGEQPNEWIVRSKRAQNSFDLPLVVEKAGNYQLSVEETTAHLEINEQEETSEEVPVEETESSEDDPTGQEELKEENGIEEDQENEKSNGYNTFNETDEIRFSMDLEEYLQADYKESVEITVKSNKLVEEFRIVVPKGTDFSVESEQGRDLIDNYEDGSSLWLIRLSEAKNHFHIISSSSQSGQIVVEDAESAFHAVFLYIDILANERSQSTNEAMSRTSVNVSTWAQFRTAWNNASRTIINLTAAVERTATTTLNHRSTDLTITSSGVGSLSNSSTATTQLELPFSSHIILQSVLWGVVPQGGNLTLSSNGTIDNVTFHNSTLESSITLDNLSISDSGSFSSYHPITIRENLKLSGTNFLLRTFNGPIFRNEVPVIEIDGSNGLALFNHYNLLTTASVTWSGSTQATINSGIVTESNQSTLTTEIVDIFSRHMIATRIRYSGPEVPPIIETSVIVNYIDTEGNDLTSSEIIKGNVGDSYETTPRLISGWELIEEPENSRGTFTVAPIIVNYVYDKKTNVSPVDPINPETEVDPENKPELPEDQGLLSIDFVSSFNFGSQAISVHDQTYYAQPQRLLNEDGTVNEAEDRPNYVQISDRRSENERSGWELAVTQKEQFKGEENQVLNGASISLSNKQVVTAQGGTAPGLQSVSSELIPGNRRTLLKAQGNEGTGTWIYRFGDAETAGSSVALNVPKGANPEATSYSTTLTWELSAVPEN